MDEQLEEKRPTYECVNKWFNPYYGTKDKMAKEGKDVYTIAKEKGINPDKQTGLFFDCADGVSECVPIPDIRHQHAESETHYNSGLEPEKSDIPKIVTLEEKAVACNSYKKILALASIAVDNQKSVFNTMESNIDRMRAYARTMLATADKMEECLEFLRKLSVIDE